MAVCPKCAISTPRTGQCGRSLLRVLLIALAFMCAGKFAAFGAAAQRPSEWQAQVRKFAEQQDWAAAMRIVEREMARDPQDADVLAWRARILTWSGHVLEAEQEYLTILRLSRKDPDVWLGLANVYLHEGKNEEALRALDSAVELDPKRADLHLARGRALRATGDTKEARAEFEKILALDPANAEARSGLGSAEAEARHELRFGQENDLFNFAGPNHDEWVSVASRWDSRWSTNLSTTTFQRGGIEAEKFAASATVRSANWGALTAGAAVGHANSVIPKSEAFFDFDHGWKSSSIVLRGCEFDYAQHWYWYQAARVLTVSGSVLLYLPKEWTLALAATGARSAFSGTKAEWRPSGLIRAGFPFARHGARRLTGNLFFATGDGRLRAS